MVIYIKIIKKRSARVKNFKFLLLFPFGSDANANTFRGSNTLFTMEIYGFSRRAATDHSLEVSFFQPSQEINWLQMWRSFEFLQTLGHEEKFYCFCTRWTSWKDCLRLWIMKIYAHQNDYQANSCVYMIMTWKIKFFWVYLWTKNVWFK